jgi:photosystem II stability/assembly factor-like uncharacterized protein
MMARMLRLGAAAILALTVCDVFAAPTVPEMAVVRVDRLRITALALAGKRLVAAGERGRILISDDEGKTWQTAASPVSVSLSALAFSDKLGIAVGHNGTVLRSEDGGKNWTAVDVAPKDPPALFAVHVAGEHVIVVGSYGAFFESRDGGKTWQNRRIGADDFDRHLTGIAAGHPGTLLLAGEAGTLMRSTDGGEKWTALKSPYEGSYFGILGLKNGSVIAYGMRGNAYRSDDNGEHWQRVDLGGFVGAIQGGRELADGRVLLHGNDGMLAVSRPGDAGFKIEQMSNRRTLAAVLPVGARFLDAGPTGLHWSGAEEARK